MDIFENKLDAKRFQATNGPWNMLRLNSPWSVGYISSLITKQQFENKEEWEDYYYASGELRDRLIKDIDDMGVRDKLQNHALSPKQAGELGSKYMDINFEMGRTPEDLKVKGYILKMEMDKLGVDITLEECIEVVRYRVICETWNGIKHTEENTIGILRKEYPSFTFKPTSGDIDYKYAVDYEAYLGDQKLMGIQIKPESYGGEKDYLQAAKVANHNKFELYKRDFGLPVITLLAKKEGGIVGNRHQMVGNMIFNTYQQLLNGEHD